MIGCFIRKLAKDAELVAFCGGKMHGGAYVTFMQGQRWVSIPCNHTYIAITKSEGVLCSTAAA